MRNIVGCPSKLPERDGSEQPEPKKVVTNLSMKCGIEASAVKPLASADAPQSCGVQVETESTTEEP